MVKVLQKDDRKLNKEEVRYRHKRFFRAYNIVLAKESRTNYIWR